jgi:hypothetical protein
VEAVSWPYRWQPCPRHLEPCCTQPTASPHTWPAPWQYRPRRRGRRHPGGLPLPLAITGATTSNRPSRHGGAAACPLAPPRIAPSHSPEPGTPGPGTPPPRIIYARSGPDLHFFFYAIFIPREDPGLEHPPAFFPPKNFQTPNPAWVAGAVWLGPWGRGGVTAAGDAYGEPLAPWQDYP